MTSSRPTRPAPPQRSSNHCRLHPRRQQRAPGARPLHADEERDVTDAAAGGDLRYWMRWAVPIVFLVLFAGYLLMPTAGTGLNAFDFLAGPQRPPTSRTNSTAAPTPVPTSDAAGPAAPAVDPADAAASAGQPQPSLQTGAGEGTEQPAAPTSSAPTTAADADAGANNAASAPADVLAGPVDDDVLQQLLTQSMPDRLGATDPAAAASPQAQATEQAAWEALSAGLTAGGWTQPHLQARELSGSGAGGQEGQLPAQTTVVIMWSAVSAAGELQDRQLSAVRMNTTNPTAAEMVQITSM